MPQIVPMQVDPPERFQPFGSESSPHSASSPAAPSSSHSKNGQQPRRANRYNASPASLRRLSPNQDEPSHLIDVAKAERQHVASAHAGVESGDYQGSQPT